MASLSEGRQPVTPIDGASGIAKRRFAQAIPERNATEHSLARRLRARGSSPPLPGGIGAPPGDTTTPRQELAYVDEWGLGR